MKVMIIVGTRPEIIKMAPLVKECVKRNIDHYFLHTGQHFSSNMSLQFFKDLALREPDKNLDIGSGTHSEQTAKALVGIEKELEAYSPDIVLVQGDTNAVLSATIASVKMNIPVGHVEAGLRSYDTRMPEEHNRRLTDHASKYLFAPTKASAEILRKENVWGEIHVTGNTVIDTLEGLIGDLEEIDWTFDVPRDDYILLTMHRAENVDNKKTLTGLIQGISSLDENILFPAHPRTVNRLNEFNLMREIEEEGKISIIEPVGYLMFLNMLISSKYILTDSGGIQEEVTAPSINKRAFVLRTSTERPEAIESGHVTVVGVEPSEFPNIIIETLAKGPLGKSTCPYGDGSASKRIIDIIYEKYPSISNIE